VALALASAALSLLPIGYIVVWTVQLGAGQAMDVLGGPRTAELIRNTVGLVAASALVCVVIGTAAAWVVVRTTVPGRRVWAVLLALPLAVPAFVLSYTWVAASYEFAPTSTALFGFKGAVLVLSLSHYPFVYLPVAAAMRGLDPAQEEVARAMGAGPVKVLVRIVLPQLRTAILGGAIIIGLHMLAEFGALALLRYDTFTTVIFNRYGVGQPESALVLSVVLIALCVAMLALDWLVRRHTVRARAQRGAHREPAARSLGRATVPVLGGLTAFLAVALGVPVVSLVVWLVRGTDVGLDLGEVAATAATSLGLAGGAAVITSLLALPVAIYVIRHPGPVARLAERSTYVAHSIPGVVIALALVFFATNYAFWLYQTVPLLLLGYAVLFLPIAGASQQGALIQAPRDLEEQAAALGVAPLARLLRITVPLAARGIGAGAVLVFLDTMKELTATLLLRPTGMDTLATRLWTKTTVLDYAGAAPYAVLIIALSALPAWLISRRVLAGGAPARTALVE
jgi:iron(III) transport system permease protein